MLYAFIARPYSNGVHWETLQSIAEQVGRAAAKRRKGQTPQEITQNEHLYWVKKGTYAHIAHFRIAKELALQIVSALADILFDKKGHIVNAEEAVLELDEFHLTSAELMQTVKAYGNDYGVRCRNKSGVKSIYLEEFSDSTQASTVAERIQALLSSESRSFPFDEICTNVGGSSQTIRLQCGILLRAAKIVHMGHDKWCSTEHNKSLSTYSILLGLITKYQRSSLDSSCKKLQQELRDTYSSNVSLAWIRSTVRQCEKEIGLEIWKLP